MVERFGVDMCEVIALYTYEFRGVIWVVCVASVLFGALIFLSPIPFAYV